ncbi:hypothetical protein [Massilia rhizosphaerae]|uniref:hypothetical protein n=1 Tax=Massilia rhizosphaerae TaxID=2784389 RepID=UPI0018DE6FC7|nr:hypothetical protein [Massilia rhizosphaerae]
MPSPSAAGVAAGFPEPSAYLKKLTFGFNSRILQARLDDIQRVSRVGLGFEYVLDNDTFTYSMHRFGDDLWVVFVTLRREAIRLALGGKDGWEAEWRRAVAYGYWSLAMQMDARRATIERNAADGGENWGAPGLEWFGGVAGDCLALGWTDYARDLARRARWMDSMRGFPDGAQGYQRATQRFVLRLIEDGNGTAEGDVGVPEFDTLLANWRSAPAADLAPVLLAACDRHTHQCRSTDTDMEFDLPFEAFWYDPYEILAVLRLRASAGLDNPALGHPLLDTPLGRLQGPSAPVLDEVLAAAVSAC